jgi:hypothetical protein
MVMKILLVTCLLQLAELNSPRYLDREWARYRIIRSDDEAMVIRWLAEELTSEQRHSLRYCLAFIRSRRTNLEYRKLLGGQPSRLLGWPEFAGIVGDDEHSRTLYGVLYREHRTTIELFFERPELRAVVMIQPDAWGQVENLTWHRNTLMSFFLCLKKNLGLAGVLKDVYGNSFYGKEDAPLEFKTAIQKLLFTCRTP